MRFQHNAKPIAKQRHRTAYGRTYDPQHSVKLNLKGQFALQFRSQPALFCREGAIAAHMDIRYPIPSSWSKKRKTECLGKYVTTKPDLDNYEKMYLDVLSNIAYKDDSQVARLSSIKKYSDKPGVDITLLRLEDRMINEHAITYRGKLSIEDLNYIIKKANRIGLNGRQIVRVYQDEDSEGTHLYFCAEGLKEHDE